MTRADADRVARVHQAAARAGAEEAYPNPGRWVRNRSGTDYVPSLEDPQQLALVGTVAGSVVGFATADCAFGSVRAVYVHPDHQGCGVGTALLERVEAALERAGFDIVELTSSLNAVGFYAHWGYMVTSRTTLDEADVHFPVVEMERPLST